MALLLKLNSKYSLSLPLQDVLLKQACFSSQGKKGQEGYFAMILCADGECCYAEVVSEARRVRKQNEKQVKGDTKR